VNQLGLTYEQYMALPEGCYELHDGVLYVPASPGLQHQVVLGNLLLAVNQFLADHPGVGAAVHRPCDVVLRREWPGLIVQPDLIFLAGDYRKRIVDGQVAGAPDLAVEIVVPATARLDAVLKREIYARHGFREYWLAWPGERLIDVFTLDAEGRYGAPRTFGVGDRLETPLLPGLAIDVGEIFED